MDTAPGSLDPMQSSTFKEQMRKRHYNDYFVYGSINFKHFNDDSTKIDIPIPNYISAIESIVTAANRITDTVHHRESEGSLTSNVVIEPPLCILHRISSELSCKPPGVESAHDVTQKIFEILTNYPWEAKAALALLAFATDYGDLWHPYPYSHTDPLAKSLAIIKRVGMLKKHLDSLPYQQVLLNPNSLIQMCLQAIKCMNEIREFKKYYLNDPLELASALRQIPLVTYWVIHIIVVSGIELSSYLTETENQPQVYLNELSNKITSVLTDIERQLYDIRVQHEEVDLYRWLVDHIEHFHTNIALVVSKLLSGKPETNPIIDGSTQKEVGVHESLSGKNVILLISGLDISEDDIKAIHNVYDELKTRGTNYEIVWIPIIPEPYHGDDPKRYEYLRSTMKWYSIQFTTRISGMRYIKEKWQFREDPLVVVLNPNSKVEFMNAIHLIRVWENEAIPFTQARTESLLKKHWPESTLHKFTHQPRLPNLIKSQKSIIFYGGRNPSWIQQFEEKVEILKNDPLIIDGGSFEIVRIGKDAIGEDDPKLMARFWKVQWGYFIVKSQIKGLSASETSEDILRLVSYENEDGWAVVTIGSAPLLVGNDILILRLFDDFPNWKQNLHFKAFPNAFRDSFNELALKTHECDRVIFPEFSGWIPMIVNCPGCPRFMQKDIAFKCCHGGSRM
ncbi:protein SIEVE ELEMENT OCCLUSION B-like isoform X2 [Cucurbita pepo subsp. pepo]|uniref:protein SIEVE ELEMENT OCCLUSION B-like isoform X2 n=1 Tax=Cucurbita pepo subsp. pepo TaxID=3664 RepID=UPI000C9D8CBB|nr:protein SIEVE ELEMENT OCCLUSION B-like isoform X2 [Cucurbita pepo subsp. pepo]